MPLLPHPRLGSAATLGTHHLSREKIRERESERENLRENQRGGGGGGGG
eukprot:COSAG03_NODE_13751_length_489_cov_2.112821_1_plen_48_part_10